MTQPTSPQPSAQPQASGAPSWANLFARIEFTPEEEAVLDAIWASPEMQEAVKKTPPKQEDIPPP